tara:strand:- start:8494 stop:9780 length:1287 start_codon:yes stop_codon:yes gene_type:complete
MIPNSKIKNELKQKMNFSQAKSKKSDLAGSIKSSVNSIKKNVLAPERVTPGSVSVMTFLKTKTKERKKSEFESMKPIKYYYYPIEFLNKDIENISLGKKINMCIFTVNTEISKPFLMFLLSNRNGHFSWPQFTSKKNVKSECNDKLINLQILNDVEFSGYVEKNNEFYVFYKLIDNFDYDQNIKSTTPFWFVTMFEILFSRKVIYFKIESSVYNIFIKERRLQYLLDKNNLYYQIPLVMYNGVPSHKLDFYLEAGLLKASILASQGPYYYFANYLRAAKFGSWNVIGGYKEQDIAGELITDNEFGRYIKGGVIRFVVYPGKSKVVMNKDWDSENEQRKGHESNSKEQNKIYDTKGNWTKEYDSVILGPIKVDNKILHNGTSLTVKNYYQYKSLSYHYLDKKSIPEQYTPDIDKNYTDVDLTLEHLRIE